MNLHVPSDGIHSMLPRELMCESVRKLRDAYERKPDAPIFQNEFGFFALTGGKRKDILKENMMYGT